MVVDVTSCAANVSDIQLPLGSGPSRYRALRVTASATSVNLDRSYETSDNR